MQNHTTTGTAAVVGATGIIGRAIAAKLAELGGWCVIGDTRPAPDPALLFHAGAGPALVGDGGQVWARPARARAALQLGFLDFMFAIEYDIVLALGKTRRAGFVRYPDTLEGFFRRFDDYRRARNIPTF